MEKIFAPEEGREVIQGWLIHARKSWKKHDEAARRLEAQYRKVGVASTVLSAVVGASLFASLESAFEPWSRIIAGFISIIASVLSSLITFHRYEERTEKHRLAGVGYKEALRTLENLHSMSFGSKLPQNDVNQLQQKFDLLEKSIPVVPIDINKAIEDEYQEYVFVPKAKDLRPVDKKPKRRNRKTGNS